MTNWVLPPATTGTAVRLRTGELPGQADRGQGLRGGATRLAPRLDRLRVIAWYDTTIPITTTTTTTTPIADKNLQGPSTACAGGVANCFEADGANAQSTRDSGARSTRRAPRTSTATRTSPSTTRRRARSARTATSTTRSRACYDPKGYYNYASRWPRARPTEASTSTTRLLRRRPGQGHRRPLVRRQRTG